MWHINNRNIVHRHDYVVDSYAPIGVSCTTGDDFCDIDRRIGAGVGSVSAAGNGKSQTARSSRQNDFILNPLLFAIDLEI